MDTVKDKILAEIKDLREFVESQPGSREMALVRTKLEEAELWMGKVEYPKDAVMFEPAPPPPPESKPVPKP